MDYDAFIDRVIKAFKPSEDYIYNKQVLIELYETEFGICDHLTTADPLASVKFHPVEQYHKDFLYDGHLSTFIYRDIGRKLNISFDEYIARPRYEIEAILRVIDHIDSKKAKANEDMLRDLEQSASKPSEH